MNIPDYVLEYMRNIIDNGDYENADNFRAFKVGEDCSEYDTIKANGCCGFYDEEHTINGKEWWIGFNYGH